MIILFIIQDLSYDNQDIQSLSSNNKTIQLKEINYGEKHNS